MGEGIRATVEVPDPESCPIVSLTRSNDAVVERIWRSVRPAGSPEPTVSEFEVEDSSTPEPDDCTHVMSLGTRHVYRRVHDDDRACPCECLGSLGCPTHRYKAENGRLRLVFNAADYDELQAAITGLRDRFPGLDVRRLLRSPDPATAGDPVFVDRSRLTDRQREVLLTAYRMGYFERPRRSNATEVAAALDIDPSTLAGHLATAQAKVLDDLFDGSATPGGT